MNIQKFTQKSIEAVNDCERIANEYGNQEIVQEHLLMSLLRQDDSLILKLVQKMDETNVPYAVIFGMGMAKQWEEALQPAA